MPVRYHPTGVVTRDRIMREVRRSEAAGEPPLTARELARRLRLSSDTASRQVAHLVEAGELVRIEVAVGIWALRARRIE